MCSNFHLIFVGLLGLSLARSKNVADECEVADDVSDETSLMQTKMLFKKRLTMTAKAQEEEECGRLIGNVAGDTARFNQNNRKYHTHKDDFDRSIIDVLAEHPGVDGYCYFNYSASYIIYNDETRYPILGLNGIMLLCSESQYAGLNGGPVVNFTFQGDSLTTHIDCLHYTYDDLYGYALGFLQGQGLDTSLMTNNTAWEALSVQRCEQIQQTYKFSKDELIWNDFLDTNELIGAMSICTMGAKLPERYHTPDVIEKAGYHSAEDCKPIARRMFAKHHYMKCLCGVKNSASDMAYLHSRACLLEGGRIGHFSECPYNPINMTAYFPETIPWWFPE